MSLVSLRRSAYRSSDIVLIGAVGFASRRKVIGGSKKLIARRSATFRDAPEGIRTDRSGLRGARAAVFCRHQRPLGVDRRRLVGARALERETRRVVERGRPSGAADGLVASRKALLGRPGSIARERRDKSPTMELGVDS